MPRLTQAIGLPPFKPIPDFREYLAKGVPRITIKEPKK